MNQPEQNFETKKTGYFVAFADEAKTLRKEMMINTGRIGVFCEKDQLINKLAANKALEGKNMAIVEISVPVRAIIADNPQEGKFGFTGKEIPIIKFHKCKLSKQVNTPKEKVMAVA